MYTGLILQEKMLRREYLVRYRLNPILYYNNTNIVIRFRISKQAALLIFVKIGRKLDDGIMHNSSVSPLNSNWKGFLISEWGFVWDAQMYSVM